MRKSEVEFHADGCRSVHAAVNVKLRTWKEPDAAKVAEDCGASKERALEFSAWWAKLSDESKQKWADIATQDGWETLQDEAQNAGYGPCAKVYSEGRSSGWAVLSPDDRHGRHCFTREDVAGWDAIALAKWARFARYCRETCEGIPYNALWSAYTDGFEPMIEEREVRRNNSFFYDVPGPVEVPA